MDCRFPDKKIISLTAGLFRRAVLPLKVILILLLVDVRVVSVCIKAV
jgi:hypothetical protein